MNENLSFIEKLMRWMKACVSCRERERDRKEWGRDDEEGKKKMMVKETFFLERERGN
jgi:hypothetical protein